MSRDTGPIQTVWEWEHGRREMTLNDLSGACALYGVSAEWVLTGEGPPERGGPSDSAEALTTLRRALAALASDPVEEMLRRARKLVNEE